MNQRSPIVSEFETDQAAADYDAWLHRKVARALADPRPSVPHDAVMMGIDAVIARKEASGRTC